MADVVGVVFQDGSKAYHFNSAGFELALGDRVVVQTSKGAEIGQVVEAPHHVDDELAASLKKVVRIATDDDLHAQACTQRRRKEVMAVCRELIEQHSLDMKLVSADISFEGDRVTFSFYAEERVDFRGLVADLSQELRMRVELRQIGAREEARMVGGLGPCGRHLCCALFRGDDEPVSIRMAKEQNLPLNPVKISGLCGRLMCCLKYEQQQYVTFRKEAPSRGARVVMPTGDATVTGYHVPKEAITVRLEDGSHADLCLKDCELQEDGSYIFTPRVEAEPSHVSADARFSLPGLSSADRLSDADETGGPDGAEAQPDGDGGGEESKSKSKRRSRRPRNRRSRSQSTTVGSGGDTGGESGTAAKSDAGRRIDSSRSERAKSTSGEATRPRREISRAGSSAGDAGEQSSGADRKPRRRRRRRPGGASNGAPSGGDGGSSGGGGGSGSSGEG